MMKSHGVLMKRLLLMVQELLMKSHGVLKLEATKTCSHRFQSGFDHNGNAMYTDHFFLAMQWQYGRAGEFTIHGLWPGDSQKLTSPPEFCDRGNTLSPIAIQPLRTDLHSYWPDLERGNDYKFWELE
ncbi:hypothetical protein FRX31_032248 [Thalictrum thalictroides]|uniref:Uncharacterized protein n=1 Tax=Thalictrum thalictroides TaxID=46969 RepID=A0A7J6V1V1_THATH|nr:hypothetical protein FRX31_032248 [Thalictrum thalictroides]